MKWDYRWMLDEEAYTSLRALRTRERRKLEVVFDFLRDHPFADPSFVDFDADGKKLFYRFVDRFAIAYHVDHAVRLVVIQQISENS